MRFSPDVGKGLSEEQVIIRQKQNLTNHNSTIPTKTIPQIMANHTFTLFNGLNLFLAIAVFFTGSYKNLFFMGIVICNTIISMAQEIRSKREVDKLSVLSSRKTTVIRNAKIEKIENDDIVLDDIMILKPGNQVVADCIIKEGIVEVNEAFITGESETVKYQVGDMILSGSFIVVGSCKAKVEHVGCENYTNTISGDAKYVKPINSVLMKSLNKIIKTISFFIIPLGLLLFYNQYQLSGNTIEQAILNTVAALIGMIPEGLVLLTSTVLAVSVIRLSKLNVLVQELYCIEMLARVDVICLDKTGTITTGNMKVVDTICLDKKYDLSLILGNIMNSIEGDNATFQALQNYFPKKDNWALKNQKPFSPVYKYMSATFDNDTYYLGAPEFIYDKEIEEVKKSQKKYRVLLLGHTKKESEQIPKDIHPIGYILLEDELRPSANKILTYLREQDVNIKIISGDNKDTVCNIAIRAGVTDAKGIDVSKLTDEQLGQVVLTHNIFGRVSPIQKKKMIEILQENNHFVAMTGDGVNDVLALKQADCSITVGNATDAARNVSQLVLLDNDFDAVPNIVKEGRKTVNNIERSATLFLAKTTYAFLLALLFIFVDAKYPFQPIQLTLTNFFTIGIPSFILALEANNERIKGNFLKNVISKSIPTGMTIVLNIVLILGLGSFFRMDGNQISTVCVIMTGFTGFLLLFKLCMPFNKLRITLLTVLIIGFIISIGGFREFFALTILNTRMFIFITALVFISTILFQGMTFLIDQFIKKHPKIFT